MMLIVKVMYTETGMEFLLNALLILAAFGLDIMHPEKNS